jgi:hypothetical protein
MGTHIAEKAWVKAIGATPATEGTSRAAWSMRSIGRADLARPAGAGSEAEERGEASAPMSDAASSYETRPIEAADATAEFSCGKRALDDYFARHAVPNAHGAGPRRPSSIAARARFKPAMP